MVQGGKHTVALEGFHDLAWNVFALFLKGLCRPKVNQVHVYRFQATVELLSVAAH